MTSKNNRAPLLYYIKFCVSFQIHRWIQTEVTLRKRSIRVEISIFLSLVTFKFDGWPWKTIGNLFYTTSSFVHHFKSIGELKLKLQSRNAQFGSKSAIFCPVWPWNLTDALEKKIGHLFYVASSFVHHFTAISEFKLELQSGTPNLGQIRQFLKPCDLEIWQMSLQNNRAPLLCYFKLCASFHTHWWIKIWVTVRKCSIRVKSDDCLSRVT